MLSNIFPYVRLEGFRFWSSWIICMWTPKLLIISTRTHPLTHTRIHIRTHTHVHLTPTPSLSTHPLTLTHLLTYHLHTPPTHTPTHTHTRTPTNIHDSWSSLSFLSICNKDVHSIGMAGTRCSWLWNFWLQECQDAGEEQFLDCLEDQQIILGRLMLGSLYY